MLRWLAIIAIVSSVFITILLLLGYLLTANEASTTALKPELEQSTRDQAIARIVLQLQQEAQQSMNDASLQNSENSTRLFVKTVQENLICQSNVQCVVVNIPDSVALNGDACAVALNHIGASRLQKLFNTTDLAEHCRANTPPAVAICQQNICLLK